MTRRKGKDEKPQLPSTVDSGAPEDKVRELRTYEQIIKFYEDLIHEVLSGMLDDKRAQTVAKLVKDLKDTVKDREESSPDAKNREFAQVAKMIAFAKSLTTEQALDLLVAKDFGGLLESQVPIDAEVKDVTVKEETAYEVLRSKGIVLGGTGDRDAGPDTPPASQSSSGAVSPPTRP